MTVPFSAFDLFPLLSYNDTDVPKDESPSIQSFHTQDNPLELKTRVAELEQAVALLRIELEAEKRERVEMSMLVPTLRRNQDELLKLLQGLQSQLHAKDARDVQVSQEAASISKQSSCCSLKDACSVSE